MKTRCIQVGLITGMVMALAIFAGGCGDDDSTTHTDAAIGDDATGDPCEATPDNPSPPTVGPSIGIATLHSVFDFRAWRLVGNALTPGDDTLDFRVVLPTGADCVDVWMNGEYAGRHTPELTQSTLSLDISELPIGEHELLLAAPDAPQAFAQRTF